MSRGAADKGREIDEIVKSRFERLSRIIAGRFCCQWNVSPRKARGFGLKKPEIPVVSVTQFGRRGRSGTLASGVEDRICSSGPRILELRQPVFRLVAGDQAGVDGADRCADDPIWLDFGFMHGLINPGLIGAKRAAPCRTNTIWPKPETFLCPVPPFAAGPGALPGPSMECACVIGISPKTCKGLLARAASGPISRPRSMLST